MTIVQDDDSRYIYLPMIYPRQLEDTISAVVVVSAAVWWWVI